MRVDLTDPAGRPRPTDDLRVAVPYAMREGPPRTDPSAPEMGHYVVPEPVAGFKFPMSNDVFRQAIALIYLIDRHNGLDVLKFTGERKAR